MTQPTDPTPSPTPSYEQPDEIASADRPASAMPTKHALEYESPAGHDSRAGGHDPYAALRVPEFRLYFIAFLLTVIAGQIQTAAVGWEIYTKTGKAEDLGWLGLVLAVPMLVLSLPAGQWADRYSRKKLFLFMQVISAACALGLTIVSTRFHDHPLWLGMVFTLLGVGAAGATVGRPSREALMSQLVPAKLYPNAITWNSTSFELSSMVGPAIGGLIVWLGATHGPTFAYATAAAAWAAAFVLIARLPDRSAHLQRAVDEASAADADATITRRKAAGFADLVEGLRFVFRTKLLLAALTLDLFAVLFGGAVFLLPIFAKDILHVGAFGFGCLRAAGAIGAVSMALVQAHMPPFKRAGPVLLIAVTGFGLATIVFGLSESYLLSFLMLMAIGALDNISVVIRHSLVPLLTPDRMRGRVLAVNQIFVGSSNELGGLESGLTAKWFGAVASVVVGGILSIVVVFTVAIGFPQVRKLNRLNDVKPAEE